MVKKKIFHNSGKDTKIDSIGKVIQYLYYRFSEFYKRTEKTSNSYIKVATTLYFKSLHLREGRALGESSSSV